MRSTQRTIRHVLGATSIAGVMLIASLANNTNVRAQSTGVGTTADPTTIDKDVATVTEEIEKLGREGSALDAEAQALPARKDAVTQRARRQIRVYYHLVQSQPMSLKSGPESSIEHMGRLQHVRRALRATLAEVDQVNQRAGEIAREKERIARETASATARKTELEAARTQAQQQTVLRNIALPPSTAYGNDTPTADWTTSFAPPSPSVTVYGGAAPAMGPGVSSFSQAAGRLLLPIAGRAEVRRAMRQGAAGPGLEVIAALGAPVRAVYPGRVSFADRYGAYGRIVILDHGEHYYSVSANLGAITVRVGEEVSAGTVLGTVGDDGRGPLLYFELRQGSATLDPAPWFGL